jgi:DNA-binding CsgD family transcriptional regulator
MRSRDAKVRALQEGCMRVRDYETAVSDCATPEALWALAGRFFRDTVVTRMIYLHLAPIGAPDERAPTVRADGYPEGLVARYLTERLFRDNPLLRQAQISAEPVYWDKIATDRSLTPRERGFVAELRGHGLGAGVGIPVYGPSGRVGHCGLGFRPGVRRLAPGVLRDYQWICQLGHLRYCDLLQARLGPPPVLSEREREVLGLVARGKSNTTIGEILGISSHTVDAHLRRIYKKLGVFDRISAAVRGIGVGLVRAEG